MDSVQETLEVVNEASRSILDVGIVGALLVLSLTANVALVWALVRCYRAHMYYKNSGGQP